MGGLLSVTVHQGPNSRTYFYCYNASGNVAALVSASDGSVAARYDYGTFGELLRATGPMAHTNPFLFSTKFCDWETGFYYYGFRYYDPGSGGWLSRDPLGEVAGLNLSGFVDNDPQNAVDTDGEDKYRPYDYQNRIPNSVTYDLGTGQQKASDGFPLSPNLTAIVFIGACGEVVGGVVLLLAPEPTLSKVGGGALALDGSDKLQGMFRRDRTIFEKGMIAISGDPNYDPSTSVLLKDLGLSALTIAATPKTLKLPSQCCSKGPRVAGQMTYAEIREAGYTITDRMSRNQFKKLVADIQKNGLLDKVIKYVKIGDECYILLRNNRVLAAMNIPGTTEQLIFEEVQLPFRGYKTAEDFMDAAAQSTRGH